MAQKWNIALYELNFWWRRRNVDIHFRKKPNKYDASFKEKDRDGIPTGNILSTSLKSQQKYPNFPWAPSFPLKLENLLPELIKLISTFPSLCIYLSIRLHAYLVDDNQLFPAIRLREFRDVGNSCKEKKRERERVSCYRVTRSFEWGS